MAFSFPSNPTLNQTYTFNSSIWTFNGKGWSKAATGGASVTAGSTAPASPTEGAMWLENESGDLYVYGGGNWILAGGSGGNSFSGSYTDLIDKPTITSVLPATVSDQVNTSTGYFDLPSGNTAQRPASATAGALRLNTETNYLEIYNGTGWVQLQYAGSMLSASYTGATASTDGNYRVLVYNGSGTFTTTLAPVGTTVEYLVIAGGGGGGGSWGSGGGGAGGYLAGTLSPAASTTYTITVGAGGVAGAWQGAASANGADSVISATGLTTITAIGGGRGGSEDPGYNALTGGSGGGGSNGTSQSNGLGAAGTTGQGNAGANGSGPYISGGGGGGSGSAGFIPTTSSAGTGGAGTASAITGTAVTRAGGGGGGAHSSTYQTGGTGGSGGGANGGSYGGLPGAATVNTGSGGGGAAGRQSIDGSVGTNGASGVVILRYRFQ